MPREVILPSGAQELTRKMPANPNNILTPFYKKSTPATVMQWATYRLVTFTGYLFPAGPIRPEILADLGLYYSDSDEQTVQCRFCFGISMPINEVSQLSGLNPNQLKSWHSERANYCPVALGIHNTRNIPLNAHEYDFRYEIIRLLSLLKATMDNPQLWSRNHLTRCLELAKDGFYHVGPEDKVRCAFCRLEISNWGPEDNVRKEHVESNNACPFISGTGNLGNVKISDEILADLGNDSVVWALPDGDNQKLAFPNYRNQGLRENSFDNKWPHQFPYLHAKRMATCGFFFTGQNDLVACYHCGLGFHKWNADDLPEEVHKRLSYTCPVNGTM